LTVKPADARAAAAPIVQKGRVFEPERPLSEHQAVEPSTYRTECNAAPAAPPTSNSAQAANAAPAPTHRAITARGWQQ
jgi:hypothetical protein